MNKSLLTAVYDSKAQVFSKAPISMRNRGEALRMWMDAVNDPASPFSKHPEDYTLFVIAEYDEFSGEIWPLKAHESLGTALEMLRDADGEDRGAFPGGQPVLKKKAEVSEPGKNVC